jgi:hypothetical protein
MKSFPLLFSSCCPVTPKSAPVIFFRGISLEIPMESAFVDDIAGIFDPFLRFSPVFCPVIFPQWRRVRIRLHPQPASPVSASWFPGVGEPPAFPGFRLKALESWRQYSRSCPGSALLAGQAIAQDITLNGVARSVSLVNAIYHCRQYYPIDTALLERFDRAFNDVGEKAAAAQLRRQHPISCVMIMSTLLVALALYGPSIAAGFGVGFSAGYFVRAIISRRRRRAMSARQSIQDGAWQSIQDVMRPPQLPSSSLLALAA